MSSATVGCVACGCVICGSATQPCGCCDGVQVLTPQSVHNRAGLPALNYRVGTHGSFLETMKARLSTMEVDGQGADGQPLSHLRPMKGLTTRNPSDPSIALLDAWATVGDVLSFYQERIANEAYLRTATERRSVLELARLVGYKLRPGVAASTYLAYTLDDNQKEPVTIAACAGSQSVPDLGEQPQTFETSDDLKAQREWNNLQVRLKQPQNITLDNVLKTDTLQVAGSSTNLKAGDKLLLVFSDDGSAAAVRVVASVDSQFADKRSAITLHPIDPLLLRCTDLLMDFVAEVATLVATDASGETRRVLDESERILAEVYLGTPSGPAQWALRIGQSSQDDPPQPVLDAIAALGKAIEELKPPADGGSSFTDPTQFVVSLLKPTVLQARSSVHLTRSLSQAFSPTVGPLVNAVRSSVFGARAAAKATATVDTARAFTDVGTQLLVNFVPNLERSYYAAWAGAQLNPAQSSLKAVYALRSRVSLFGAAGSKLPTYTKKDDPDFPAGLLNPQDQWNEWLYQIDETQHNAFLDQANEAVVAGSYALAETDGNRAVLRITEASTAPRTAYGLSGQTTRLVFETPNNESWRDVGKPRTDGKSNDLEITGLRKTKLYVQSEPLTLIDAPITTAVDSPQIQLDGLYNELTSGRWVILSGERADIDKVGGVKVCELQMISGLSHGFDPNLPGDQIHTTLVLATRLAYRYKRDTLTIHGNVVKATQGGTRKEVLGSGDGAQGLQSFTLKQPPLTFVAAPTAEGAQSTLQVRVDSVEWQESESLAGLGPKQRGFATLTDDAGATTLTFGNGAHGARLPSGVENVVAVYRSGIGAGGNVKARQISVLQTRPLGVKEVVNPLRASGGADKESRDLARENAPLSVMPLDRLVSVQDYADFTRRFAGIAKALARRTTDGRRELIYLTIAGTDDSPIDSTSDLYRNLLDALRKLGDADLPLRVDMRERSALVLSAKVKLLPGRLWETVVSAVRETLLDSFGFNKRALGQPALLSEVISAMQGVAGVAWVDVDAFGAVPERVSHTTTDPDGTLRTTRELLSQEKIVEEVQRIVGPNAPTSAGARPVDRQLPNVAAWPGGLDQGALRPAEVAVFTPAVTDTLILNQAL